jgi:tetratricopeptide (TPR) repeat protein
MGDQQVQGGNRVIGSVHGTVFQAKVIKGDVHVHPSTRQYSLQQLPPIPAGFTGREEELSALDDVAADVSGLIVVIIVGPGGIGKTALALKWLGERADQFPDGQMYADLSAFGPQGPAEPGRVLGRLLRGLGVPATEVPAELEERSALFRSITAERSIALLLDDVASTAQIQQLMPGAGDSVVVITSRSHLGGMVLSGARVLPLSLLREDDATALVVRTLGSERAATEEPRVVRRLAELCGGMPLALRVATARLVTRPRWRVGRMVRELTDDRRRLGALVLENGEVSVEAVFEVSYRELNPAAARMYRRMALHPGAVFGSEVAAAAVGASVEAAEDVLDVLVETSMLAEVGEDCYRMHDLQRLHARDRAERDDDLWVREKALRAMAEWYLDRAVTADLVATSLRFHLGEHYLTPRAQRFTSSAEALDWLETQLPNLMAVLRAAAESGWDDLAWKLSDAMWGLFLYRGFHPEWLESCTVGAVAAGRLGDPVAESRLLVHLAAAHLRLGDPAAALRAAQPAWERARDGRDWRAQATALESLGRIAHSDGRLEDAVGFYSRALVLNEQHNHPRGIGLVLCALGYALSGLGDDSGAADCFERAIRTATSIADHTCRAQALVGLGETRARQHQYDRAIAEMTEGLATLDPAAPALRVDVVEKLGDVTLLAGDRTAARRYWEQALELLTALRHPRAHRLRERLGSLKSA